MEAYKKIKNIIPCNENGTLKSRISCTVQKLLETLPKTQLDPELAKKGVEQTANLSDLSKTVSNSYAGNVSAALNSNRENMGLLFQYANLENCDPANLKILCDKDTENKEFLEKILLIAGGCAVALTLIPVLTLLIAYAASSSSDA